FVKAVAAVNDPCVFDVKKDQRRRDPLNKRSMPYAHDLKGRSCGISKRTEQIERGMHRELPPDLCDSCRCPMEERRTHETYALLIETPFDNLRRGSRVHAERFEDIGAPAVRRRGARPMFRYR